MMLFVGVTKGTVKPPPKRATPTMQNAGRIICRQPFPGGAVNLAIAVGDNRCRSRKAREGGGGDRFAIRANRHEFVHEFNVGNDRVDRRHREVLLFGGKLVEEVLIARVESAEEEHHLQNLRDGHRRTREGRKMPLEAGTEFMDPLLVPLPVIEERQQGGEGV
jgi:hypothetical protein